MKKIICNLFIVVLMATTHADLQIKQIKPACYGNLFIALFKISLYGMNFNKLAV